jgi:hypothetical protein
MPREVESRRKTVRTGIWKTYIRGRMFAGQLNVAGDR